MVRCRAWPGTAYMNVGLVLAWCSSYLAACLSPCACLLFSPPTHPHPTHRTPFADLPFVPKMHAICNPHHVVSYPDLSNKDLLDVMRRCLDRDPKTRITLQV